jgi:hypothetical protein
MSVAPLPGFERYPSLPVNAALLAIQSGTKLRPPPQASKRAVRSLLPDGGLKTPTDHVQLRGGFHGPTPPMRSAVILVTYPGGGSGIAGNTTSGPR